MKHYRVNKVTKPGGAVVKTKDTLAASDRQAVETARADTDCPVCEVWHAAEKVGTIT
ncbi:MAG TPA: hypothetical protein VHM92_01450 [Allosphingosinicella sp.]|nr:hypothetical protein [Allosphingosinicella sp.]